MRLHELGWNEALAAGFAEDAARGWRPGRVIAEQRGRFTVGTEAGEMPAHLPGRAQFEAAGRVELPVVGDWVALSVLEERPPRAVVRRVLPRRSLFSRSEPGPRTEQPVAANIDTVFLLVGLDGNFRLARIERYLAAGWQSGAWPVVLLTKADLCPDVPARLREARACAGAAPVHALSVLTGEGLEVLSEYLAPGQTLALLGSSGVGKSTLLNHLLGREAQKIQAVRAADQRGRHTTVHRELFVLPSGALVVDTPGMRELQLYDAGEGLATAFPDIEDLAAGCRFDDCRHAAEPGCAVQAALGRGELDARRFESYQKMQRELGHAESRESQRARLAVKRAHRIRSRAQQQLQRRRECE